MTDESTRAAMEHDVMRRTRQTLESSKWQRQYATAMFPLVVARMAGDLAELLQMQRSGVHGMEHLSESIDYLEAKIREEYRRQFGCEMG